MQMIFNTWFRYFEYGGCFPRDVTLSDLTSWLDLTPVNWSAPNVEHHSARNLQHKISQTTFFLVGGIQLNSTSIYWVPVTHKILFQILGTHQRIKQRSLPSWSSQSSIYDHFTWMQWPWASHCLRPQPPDAGVRRPSSDTGNGPAVLEMPNRAPALSPPPRQSRGLEADF